MLINDIYKTALSFIGEKPKGGDLQDFIIGWVNLLLAEALPYENNLRRYKGITELTAAPAVTALTDTFPYQDEIAQPAFVFGLTGFIAQDDDNEYRTQKYRDMYISALYDTQKYEQQQVGDPCEGGGING